MSRLLIFIAFFVLSGQANSSNLDYEASMNFDMKNVSPFLTELNTKFDFGVDVKKLVEFTKVVPINSDKAIEVDIKIRGKKSTLRYGVFMSDLDSPDVYLFFDDYDITNEVDAFMLSWAENKGL